MTVSVYTSTEIAKDETAPGYLIEIDWNQVDPPLAKEYLCTYRDLTWNSISWLHSPVDVTSLVNGSETSTASFTYFDQDLSMRQKVLSAKLLEVKVNIWQIYGEGPFTFEDANLAFSGVTTKIYNTANSMGVTFECSGKSIRIAPKMTYGPVSVGIVDGELQTQPFFNFLPTKNETILIGSRKIRIV